jgi:hypothetical protein
MVKVFVYKNKELIKKFIPHNALIDYAAKRKLKTMLAF